MNTEKASNSTIPDVFAWHINHAPMIEKPRIQGPYSTCSIFALVSCLGDRYAIGNKIEAPYPSVAWFLYNMILKNSVRNKWIRLISQATHLPYYKNIETNESTSDLSVVVNTIDWGIQFFNFRI